MFCNSCGRQNEDNTQFCQGCGRQIGATLYSSPKGAVSPPVKRMGWLKMIAFIFLALFVLGTVVSKISDSGTGTSNSQTSPLDRVPLRRLNTLRT